MFCLPDVVEILFIKILLCELGELDILTDPERISERVSEHAELPLIGMLVVRF